MAERRVSSGPAGALRVGRVLGVDVFVRLGVVLSGVLVVAVLAPRLDEEGTDRPVLLAGVVVVSLYVSILLHELAHVAVARAHRMEVESVTLHLLGGETLIAGESRTPRQELLTAVSGPAASALIGAACLAAEPALDDQSATVAWSIGWVNLVLAAANMLPGLPLDGGRAFRAVIWAVTGRESTGVVAAAHVGRVAAVASVALGVWLATADDLTGWLDLTVCCLVATFLWQGSSQALRYAGRADRIGRLHARPLAVPDPPRGQASADLPHLPADLRGTELLRAVTRAPADAYVLVEDDGTTAGYLHMTALDAAYREGTA